ncbi:unnamed protein product [Blepharisma stoltei]|uniref:Uncharacterized protein n=1 Tax=Blepharisma stoltei TaxID=1481888 RepID=A0AAU9K4Q4_9CILI|nr:unnamed protein product [Blepharisma stoltei]
MKKILKSHSIHYHFSPHQDLIEPDSEETPNYQEELDEGCYADSELSDSDIISPQTSFLHKNTSSIGNGLSKSFQDDVDIQIHLIQSQHKKREDYDRRLRVLLKKSLLDLFFKFKAQKWTPMPEVIEERSSEEQSPIRALGKDEPDPAYLRLEFSEDKAKRPNLRIHRRSLSTPEPITDDEIRHCQEIAEEVTEIEKSRIIPRLKEKLSPGTPTYAKVNILNYSTLN